MESLDPDPWENQKCLLGSECLFESLWTLHEMMEKVFCRPIFNGKYVKVTLGQELCQKSDHSLSSYCPNYVQNIINLPDHELVIINQRVARPARQWPVVKTLFGPAPYSPKHTPQSIYLNGRAWTLLLQLNRTQICVQILVLLRQIAFTHHDIPIRTLSKAWCPRSWLIFLQGKDISK